jgi:hypothetical protein
MAMKKRFRIGVDVGGTNTDCAILNPAESHLQTRGIKSAFKTPTTPDVNDGIIKAIEGALSQAPDISRDEISAVMIGTVCRLSQISEANHGSNTDVRFETNFINAVVQADAESLRPVAVLRLCGPCTKENPSFLDFPPILRRVVEGHVAYLDGGLEFDMREILPVDEGQVRKECQKSRRD